ncbi:MAG TPA: aldo/keto reductase [Thermodesulfobacteriota bacterium]|nr:aldo/keto reductase [Thermodesulfobacteriota bacterium]
MSHHATTEGTTRYRDRFKNTLASGHFREAQGLWMSSIGFGSYLGRYDEETDIKYRDALIRAVDLGCNKVDTAINYRFQRSERSIGEALEALYKEGKASRDEIIVATKGGYIPFDGAPPKDIRTYFAETFVKPGIATFEDIVSGSHCMTPRYIENQLECSLKNLRLQCIDIYYLHNPEEQLQEVTRDEFNRRISAAFELLEKKVSDEKIRMYGTATWNGYRQEPDARDSLSLEELVNIAKDVAGEGHHFKFIQLPFNLAMPAAITLRNQSVEGEMTTVLEAAWRLGVTVIASSSLLQSRLTRNLPEFIGEHLKGLKTDAQRALQFVRSTPGVGAALVGMSNVNHVEENMKVAEVLPTSMDDFVKLFAHEE